MRKISEQREVAKVKPLRFMIYESYIMGGVGAYVIGEVLTGMLRPESTLTCTPGHFDCEVAFLDKDKKMLEVAEPFDRVGVSLPNVKCKDMVRGMVLSEKANHPARDLNFGLGFFLMINFKGELKNNTKLYYVSNRISRICRIEVQCLIKMDSEVLIGKVPAQSVKAKTIAFLRIYPVEPLVLDDPAQFDENCFVQLWDNCQTVAIGKLFKIFRENEEVPEALNQSREFKTPHASTD